MKDKSTLKKGLLLSAIATSFVTAGVASAATLNHVATEQVPLSAELLQLKGEKSIHDYTDRLIVQFNDAPMAVMNQPGMMSTRGNGKMTASAMVSTLSKRAGVPMQHIRALKNGSQVISLNNMTDMKAVNKLVERLQNDPMVSFAEPDYRRKFMAQEQPYGIGMVQADQVDDSVASANSGGKKICVIDSGLDLPHEDMGTRFGTINGTNDSGTGNWYDNGGPHGTHVAGTIAALDNGIGVVGVIGSDPSMHIVKVFNAEGWGYSSDLIDAIQICANNGSDVVNMSLGGSGSSTSESNAMQSVSDSGVLLIAAAGNDGVASSTTDALSYPASYDAVMSVAAIDDTKTLADFSQKNSQVEIAGPGVDVNSTYPEGTGSVVEVSVGSNGYSANAMENQGTASGSLYDFALGESTDAGASGKICLIQRGNISFFDKVQACENSGGVGAIIYNNAAGAFGGTLGTSNTTSIPAVTVSDTDGAAMLMQTGQSASINIGAGNYAKISGTSMASPHVAGVAALVWSHHPSCTNDEIRTVLNTTAEDLGSAGRDVAYGYGLVQAKDAIDYISANGCGGSVTPPPPTGSGELTNGVTETDLSGAQGAELNYTMAVPAGATDLNFAMAGGSGDADLYVKFGSEPTTSSYDCRPYATGNNESCPIDPAQEGTYYVKVIGYSAFSGVSLTGSFTEGSTGGPGAGEGGSATATDVSGSRRSWNRYTVDVPAGMTTLTVTTDGGSGDADLYVRFGQQSTTSRYDCRSWNSGNTESCTFNAPAEGTWHIDIRGYSAYSGLTVTATWE